MKYTVVLLYPLDAISWIEGPETYLAHVEADTPKIAKRTAQVQALRAQSDKRGWRADHFIVLFIFKRHLIDARWADSVKELMLGRK